MYAKVVARQWKMLLADPRAMLLTFLTPFVFRYLLPGFSCPGFPAILVTYSILALHSTQVEISSARVGLTQFPVTTADHVLGLFLYHASAVAFTAVLAGVYIALTGPGNYLAGILPKSLALGLLLTAVLSAVGLWLRTEVARVINVLLVILVLNFIIFQAADTAAFLPFVSAGAALLIGGAVWCLLLGLALRVPPRV